MRRMHYGRPIVLAFCFAVLAAPTVASAESRRSVVHVYVQVVNSVKVTTSNNGIDFRSGPGVKPVITTGPIQAASAAFNDVTTAATKTITIDL